MSSMMNTVMIYGCPIVDTTAPVVPSTTTDQIVVSPITYQLTNPELENLLKSLNDQVATLTKKVEELTAANNRVIDSLVGVVDAAMATHEAESLEQEAGGGGGGGGGHSRGQGRHKKKKGR